MKKKELIRMACVIVAIPVVLAICFSTSFFEGFTGGINWLGFWGSYFGGIITVTVFFGTIQDNKKREIREEKRKLFDKLISDAAHISEMQEYILSIPNDDLLRKNFTLELNTKILEMKMRLEIAEKSGMCIHTANPIKLLDDMVSEINKIHELQIDIRENQNITKNTIENIVKNLCNQGFIFEIEKFIIENNK